MKRISYKKILENVGLNSMRKGALICLCAVLIVGCMVLGWYFQKIFNNMKEQMLQSMIQNTEQVGLNISYRLKNIDEISMFLLQNVDMYKILNRAGVEDSMGQQLDDFKRLKEITEVVYGGENIFALRIFLSGDKIYSREGISFFDINSIMQTRLGIVNNAQAGLEKLRGWTGIYQEKYLDKADTNIVSNISLVRDENNYNKIVALIVVDVSEERLYDTMSALRGNYNSVDLIRSDGLILSSVDRAVIGKSSTLRENDLNQMALNAKGVLETSKLGTPYHVAYSNIPNTDWYVTVSTPVNIINQYSMMNTNTVGLSVIFFIIILIIIIIMLIFTTLSDSMVKKVREIALNIQNQGLVILDPSIEKDRYLDEIQYYIVEMTKTVVQSNKEAYDAKLLEKDFRLRALQAQINPHFLYNTLDTINWMAIQRNAEDISGIVTSLAKYFRLTLRKGRDVVTLNDEIELVNTYISIQKVRFDNMVEWESKVEDNCLECKIPKLTLQPIVENALLHGICYGKEGEGRIELRGWIENHNLLITISDNGIGMTQDEIDALFYSNEETQMKSGYGIYNVNERIKLLYGSEYGISIASRYQEGTCVTLCFPAHT